jgi:hypothetical protein
MDHQLETELRTLARKFIEEHEDEEARRLFYEACDERYSPPGEQDRKAYAKKTIALFAEEKDGYECENSLPLVELITENMAIYAGATDNEPFRPEAERLLRAFEAALGRAPKDYLEFEQWAHMQTDPSCRRFFTV